MLNGCILPGVVEGCQGSFGEVAAGDDPLVVLVAEDGADEPEGGEVGGEDPNDVGAPLDLFVEPSIGLFD